ncbi:hypothetical protein C0Q70_05834 [Pomacea canaliculata]|uniref:Tetratricopeptide repeat protein 29 n=1 Tax=Pomacea canaliculata TaxID=400727 RepID=A0A2T7PM96_POMCA|nr:tetratricopeptide repeat protein 29-like [Pomacea canaliculata]PVD34558.1 hypothetical protein C0Q70_05834 [Pomacea canaliculata]
MTTLLPPINNKNGRSNLPSYAKNVQEDRPRKNGSSRRDKEITEEHQHLQELQRNLTKMEIDNYRNSYKHTLCLEMLREGYHLSFRELFNLVRQQLEEREAAGPESFMWIQTMLVNEHEKLDTIRFFLTQAENAQRAGVYEDVYQSRYELACYFQKTGDKWLVDHFFATCLDTANLVVSDGGKMKAEAHLHVGMALEQNDKNLQAAEHFEAYYKLSKEHKDEWLIQTEEGLCLSFFADACINLCRIYTTISDRLGSEDMEKSLGYLVMAFDKAKESEETRLEGEAAYRLGLEYHKYGNVDTALVHLHNFYDACKRADDKEGMGRACDAIAKAYAKEGRKEESIEYLLQFVQTAEERGMEAEQCRAYHNLGEIYNSVGKYKEAREYFNRAYNTSRAMSDTAALQMNRVQLGIAEAHGMLEMYSTHVVQGDRTCLLRIAEWKSVRNNQFYKPLPVLADAAPQDIASSLNEEESRDGEEVEEAHNAEEEDTVINEQATSHEVEETG